MEPPHPTPLDDPLPIPFEQDARASPPDPTEEVDASWPRALLLFTVLSIAVPVACALFRPDGRGPGAQAALLSAAMWGPALARLAVARTVDRGRPAPLPVLRRGAPSPLLLLVPAALALLVHGGAAAIALATGVAEPVGPSGDGALADTDAVVGALLLVFGAAGWELGFRGWLQPRLDSAGVRGALPIVIVVEAAATLPLLALAARLPSGGALAALLLVFGLRVGTAPVWAWATYRLGTVWAAVWFHALHVGVARAGDGLVRSLGDAPWLGEAGILPVFALQAAALAVFGLLWLRGGSWNEFARWSLERARA